MYTVKPPPLPTSEGWLEQALGLVGSIFGTPEAAQAEIEQAKLAQIQAQIALERERQKASPFGALGEPGPLGVPYLAWGGLLLIGGIYLYQRGDR